MSKITNLPDAAPPTGDETVPVVQDGQTKKAPFRPLVEAAARPMLEQIQAITDELSDFTYTEDQVQLGASSLANPGAVATANAYRVSYRAFPKGGRIDTIDIIMGVAGTPKVLLFAEQNDRFVAVSGRSFSLQPGEYLGLPVGLDIPPGMFVGIFTDKAIANTVAWTNFAYYGAFPDAVLKTNGNNTSVLSGVRFNCTAPHGLTKAEARDRIGAAATSIAGASARPFSLRADLYTSGIIPAFGGWGQSNEDGRGTPPTTRAAYGAKGFGGQVLAPLRTPDCGASDFPNIGAAAYLRRRMMAEALPSNIDGQSPIVVGHAGIGGRRIDELNKGKGTFNLVIDQLTNTVAFANGKPVLDLGVGINQGEADAQQDTSRASYKAALKQLATDFDTDRRAVVAGAYPRRSHVIQTSSATGYGVNDGAGGWEICMAQYEAALESDLVCLSAASYFAPFLDQFHHDAPGIRRIGAYRIRSALFGHKFEPLWVVDSYIQGNDIVLVYNRQDIRADTELVPAQVRQGYRVFTDANVEKTDFTVSVDPRGDRVRLTQSAAPVAGFKWSYGNNKSIGLAPYIGGAGNIRDSSGDTDFFEGWPMHNWAVLQESVIA